MKMQKIKPIYIMNQEGVSKLEKKAVLYGAAELLKIAGIAHLISIKDWGAWREDDWRNPDGSLKRNQSVEWYLKKSVFNDGAQLNADLIFNRLRNEHWRKVRDHYDILICLPDLKTDIYEFVVGVGDVPIGAVISTYRFRHGSLSSRELRECIKTETIHELGHAFGLPGNGPDVYKTDPKDPKNGHCKNICVMRQGVAVPDDWVRMSDDRLRNGALCGDCRRELVKYFGI